jgi:hypothetical protein
MQRRTIIHLLLLCTVLVLIGTPLQSGLAFQDTQKTSDYSGQGLPLSTQELQALVAPVALYPDPLIAQVLAGATYPDQIVAANDFVKHSTVSGHTLMESVTAQPWDPSIKALAEFPNVLSNLTANLAWTSQLGEAYHNQQTEVMAAIQAMRGKAVNAGNLKTGAQMRVNQPTPDIVAILPANPQVIYVPEYNSTLVYGNPPVQTPGYHAANAPSNAEIVLNDGIAAGALTAGGCCEWGAPNWNCNWYHGVVYFHDVPYNGNNAWHGGYYGGYNYYGHHTYRTTYDYTHPYTGFGRQMAGTGATDAGDANNAFDASSGGWARSEDLRGWGKTDTGEAPGVFSSWGGQSQQGTFGMAGWGDRASSFRGWMIHKGTGGGWGSGGRQSQR